MVVVVLIVLWSIVLVPPAWQSHAEARRARQVDAFRRKLAVLAPAPDTPLARRPAGAARPFEAARAHVAVVAGPNVVKLPVIQATEPEPDTELFAPQAAAFWPPRLDVLRRRQQVLVVLAASTVVTLAGAYLVAAGWAWGLHGLVVSAFAAYLAGLRRLRRLAMERRTKVRPFPTPAQAPATWSALAGAADDIDLTDRTPVSAQAGGQRAGAASR